MSWPAFPGARLVSRAFGAGVALRNRLYDEGRRTIHRLPVPVVSVGNLAVGGTGKTPITEEVARLLSREGWFACILSRGYGGTRTSDPLLVADHLGIRRGPSEAGDEPFLLARRLPGVGVVVGRDRHRAGLHALAHLPVNLFVLDDGFQHRSLARDVDIVVLDATDPWAGGLMPHGRLREPREALLRAHVIVLTRVEAAGAERVRALAAEIAALPLRVPLFEAETKIEGTRPLAGGPVAPLDELEGRRVYAFCGIASPERFFDTLERTGARLVGHRAFADHHAYGRSDVAELQRAAESAGASLLLTTEKDGVRLPAPLRPQPAFHVLRHRLHLHDPERLVQAIGSRLPGPTRGGRPLS